MNTFNILYILEMMWYFYPLVLLFHLISIYFLKVLTKLIIRIKLWNNPGLQFTSTPWERVPNIFFNFIENENKFTILFWLRFISFILGLIGFIIIMINYEYVIPYHILICARIAAVTYYFLFIGITYRKMEYLRQEYSLRVKWWWRWW